MTIRNITAASALAGLFVAAHGMVVGMPVQAETAGTPLSDQPVMPAQTEQAAAPTPAEVTVTPGSTLSGIATDHGTTYVRLFDANTHIDHPDVIHPGDVVRVPAAEEQLASRPLPGAVTAAPAAVTSSAPRPPAEPAPRRQAAAPADAGIDGGVWDRLAQCESSGNWAINTGNGYYGGLQFSLSSWRGVGGSGYPHEASKATQIQMGERLLAAQGWGAWPACARKLELL